MLETNLKNLSKNQLLDRTKTLIIQERKIQLQLIEYLREIESRRLHSELGYASLWEFATRYLGLSEGAAQRRISAMRLSKAVPEVKGAIESGRLSLSNASKIQSLFTAEAKKGITRTPEEKKQVARTMEGLSQRECDRKIAEIAPEVIVEAEKKKQVSPTKTVLNLVLDSTTIEILDRLKSVLGHKIPLGNYGDLIRLLATEELARAEKKLGATPVVSQKTLEPKLVRTPTLETKKPIVQNQKAPVTAAAIVISVQKPARRSYISIENKRHLWMRSQGRCEFVSSDGRRCNSSHALQIDHIVPLSMGGKDELHNFRHLCANHNHFEAVRVLGSRVMAPFLG